LAPRVMMFLSRWKVLNIQWQMVGN
jgi:hypothetical protein